MHDDTLCHTSAMMPATALPPFDQMLPGAPSRERHQRVVAAPIGDVWPHCLADADAFIDFDEPGNARTVARPQAVDLGDGTTRIETETLVAGTDLASTRRFRPYWALIRLPSGLIRRSWLAAIDRRACR